MSKNLPVIEVLTSEEYEAQSLNTENPVLDNLAAQDNPRLPREYNRRVVAQQFMDTFHIIGGAPRMAEWANSHPTEYYRLYSKLFPSDAKGAMSSGDEKVIKMVVPMTELDK
jgi:hypothetical protein